jgi:lipid II:glycine glycyltransferase (peptidoglycan interpeptide bridge formation enzyme)
MSCEKTYERFDEDEYFIKFFQIHPYLSYANADDEFNKTKLDLQRRLIETHGEGKYSKEKCLKVYTDLLDLQIKNKIFISTTEAEMKDMLKNIKKSMNENNILHFKNILDKL